MRGIAKTVSVVALAVSVLAGAGRAAAAVSYRATMLSTGGFPLDVLAYDGAGTTMIAGAVCYVPNDPSFRHAAVWPTASSAPVDLNPGPQYSDSTCTAASGNRQVGYALNLNAGAFDAFVWTGTTASAVKLNAPGNNYSLAYGIGGDQVVGYSVDAGTEFFARAAMWTGSGSRYTYRNLHPLGNPAVTKSVTLASDGITQVGWQETLDESNPESPTVFRRAVRWKGTAASATVLSAGPLGAPYFETQANDVYGAVAGGIATLADGRANAMIWREDGTWTNLNPAGYSSSSLQGVGNGIQIGYGTKAGATHALAWFGSAASAVDLHTLLPSNQFRASYALGVDAGTGTIYGYADTFGGLARPVIWTVIPEPTFGGLLLLSLLVTQRLPRTPR